MEFFKKGHDGGSDSGVTGYWLIEWKNLFSIVVMKFNPNHRENLHSHAFNALTWWIKGEAEESFKDGSSIIWKASWKPKFTPKNNMHKYAVKETAWALSFRGPWDETWEEYNPKQDKTITLTHGRIAVK